jgi:hypothetical protein
LKSADSDDRALFLHPGRQNGHANLQFTGWNPANTMIELNSPGFHTPRNNGKNSVDVFSHLPVCDAQKIDLVAFNHFFAKVVVFLLLFKIVYAAVQFDSQPDFGSVEVENERPHRMLAAERRAAFAGTQVLP